MPSRALLIFLGVPIGPNFWERVDRCRNALPGIIDFSSRNLSPRFEERGESSGRNALPGIIDFSSYCFDKAKFEAFLAANGVTESGREITGLVS
jgi:hypothetical protein